MYEFEMFVVLILLLVALAGFILALVAVAALPGLKRTIRLLESALNQMRIRMGQMERAFLERGRQPPEAPSGVAAKAAEPPSQAPQGAPPPVPEETPPLLVPVAAQASAAGPPPLPPPVPPGLARPQPAPAADALGTFEARVGKRWMTWAGAAAIFLSVAFFLKHAFDNQWIGPTGQVVLTALLGAAMLIAGSYFTAKGWRALGQGLVGLGLAILYATFFAALSLYRPAVLSQTWAFGLMVLVTAAGTALAVLHNALPIGVLAVLGGLLTPVLVSTGQDARDALFTYLLLLDMGVLAVSIFRGWRVLDALVIGGTFLLYGGWYGQFYEARFLVPALAWLGAFYAVFLVLPFVHHVVRRRPIPIERFVMALGNATVAFAFAWLMLHAQYRHVLGFVALGMAGVYVALGAVLRRRLPGDARAIFGAIALSATFVTLAAPLQLRAHGITLAWAIEGPVLLYLAYRFAYRPARAFAAAALALAILRLFAAHWPLHLADYVPFANRQFISAAMVPLAMAIFALIHHAFRRSAADEDRPSKLTAALAAGALVLLLVHVELGGWLQREFGGYVSDCVVTMLWALGAAVYLAAGAGARCRVSLGVGAFVLLGAFCLGAAVFQYGLGETHLPGVNLRFLAGLGVVLAAFAYAWVIWKAPLPDPRQRTFHAGASAYAGGVMLLALLSAEAYTYCDDTLGSTGSAWRVGQMAITIVWAVYATGVLFIGFWRRRRDVRLTGLGLFGLSAVKLVLVDMTGVQGVSRIISFMAVGVLMICGSYLYHKLEKRWVASVGGPAAPGAPGARPEGQQGEST